MLEFISLTVVSIVVVLLIVRYVLNSRKPNPASNIRNILLLILLEIVCMVLGKYGANLGFPWWAYYSIPVLLTVFVPTFYFKMNKTETIRYLFLAFISAPLIHVVFSFFLGWKNYMPFIKVPSVWEI